MLMQVDDRLVAGEIASEMSNRGRRVGVIEVPADGRKDEPGILG